MVVVAKQRGLFLICTSILFLDVHVVHGAREYFRAVLSLPVPSSAKLCEAGERVARA